MPENKWGGIHSSVNANLKGRQWFLQEPDINALQNEEDGASQSSEYSQMQRQGSSTSKQASREWGA